MRSGEIPKRLQSGHGGCEAVGGRLLAVGNAVGAGVGVWECLWGRVRAGVLGGRGVPPFKQFPGGGGVACRLWCIVLVCSRRRGLANRHSLPFPWTLSLHRRWCPSASHRPVPFLFLLVLSFPLYFPFLSLGRLCQRSPRTFPVALCRVRTERRGWGLGVGGLLHITSRNPIPGA